MPQAPPHLAPRRILPDPTGRPAIPSYLPGLLILGGATMAGAALLWRDKEQEKQGRQRYWTLVEQAAREAGIDPALLGGVVRVESNWSNQNTRGIRACCARSCEKGCPCKPGDPRLRCEEHFNLPCLVSHVKAIGLAQIKPTAAREVGFTGPESGLCDPLTNLRMAARYLAKYFRIHKGDIRKAFATYNVGPGNVKRDTPRAQESYAGYVPKATRAYQRYRSAAVAGLGTSQVNFFAGRAA